MFVKGVKPDDNAKGVKPDGTGVQGFRLPPTFSLLWTLGPNQLECSISFSPFLPFKSIRKTPPETAAFFYFSKTENSSQWLLPTN